MADWLRQPLHGWSAFFGFSILIILYLITVALALKNDRD